jgi:hypothetical protein
VSGGDCGRAQAGLQLNSPRLRQSPGLRAAPAEATQLTANRAQQTHIISTRSPALMGRLTIPRQVAPLPAIAGPLPTLPSGPDQSPGKLLQQDMLCRRLSSRPRRLHPTDRCPSCRPHTHCLQPGGRKEVSDARYRLPARAHAKAGAANPSAQRVGARTQYFEGRAPPAA